MKPPLALRFVLLVTLSLGCLETPPLRPRAAPLRLLRVESSTLDTERLGRVPTLRLRFDRAVEEPPPDAILLLTGELSDSLRSDAAYGSLSATNAARKVAVNVARDAGDPAVVVLRAEQVLLPDTPLVLLVTASVNAADGGELDTGDGGPRVLATPMRVAPARRCGAVLRVEQVEPGAAPWATSRVYVRFDRPVRATSSAAPFALHSARGAPVAARASLDCVDADGFARCGWVEPMRPLDPSTVYRVSAVNVVARNGLKPEGAALVHVTGSRRDAARVAFGPPPVCAMGETALGGFCVRNSDRWIELRASTTLPAIVRVSARATATGAAVERVAMGAPGGLHTVCVLGLSPLALHAVTVTAVGADGAVHDTRTLGPVATAARLPRVRITEVVARPRSTSAQEYVELLNEDDVAARLTGFALAQGTSRAVLPEGAVIPPRGRAVIVGASFDPRGVPRVGDPPIAPGATVFTLRGSVAGRGLRDSGADVALVDPEGRVISFVPGSDPSRPPRAGVGLVRAETELADEDPAAWSYDAAGGCTPGAADRVP